MNPPNILGDDIIVAASTFLCTISKQSPPHFRPGNGSPRAAAPSSPGLMRRMAFTMAGSRIRVSYERLNEMNAMPGLHTPHLTPPEQETTWMKAIPKAQVNLPLIVCIVEATRQ